MIVTVEVDGVPGWVPDGGTKFTTKLSSPSKAMSSGMIEKSTQASVLPATNVASSVSSVKSRPPSEKHDC